MIIGAKNLKQLEDNCASVDIQLEDFQIEALDEVSALPPEYPGWMIPFQGMDRTNPTLNRMEELKEKFATAK